jgi:hypothetical protein
MKMTVLVNENTYSAAEYFAAALQEYNWATVVGAATTGKRPQPDHYRAFGRQRRAYFQPQVPHAQAGGSFPAGRHHSGRGLLEFRPGDRWSSQLNKAPHDIVLTAGNIINIINKHVFAVSGISHKGDC